MNEIKDLPWLRAQAGELARLVQLAPVEAVVEKLQYQEILETLRPIIATLEVAVREAYGHYSSLCPSKVTES